LFLGALGYVIYLASNLYPRYYTLIPGAAIIGFGAAVLWTAQGAFMAKCSTESTLGFHSGVFFGLFQLNAIIGNLMAALVLFLGKGISLVFWILFVCGCVADFLFLFLKNPPPKVIMKDDKGSINIGETLVMFTEPKMLLMTVVLIYSGFSQSFFYSRFPQSIPLSYLGFVMATFGAADTLGSVVMGRLSDKIVKKPVLIFATICGCGAYAMTYILHLEEFGIYIFFVIAVLLGLSDAGYNTQLYSVFGLFQPTKLESAYAFLKCIQAATTAIAFVYSLFWDLKQISLCMLISNVCGIICFIICDLFVAKVDANKK